MSLYKINSSLTEVLFIERCLNLLKPGGRMGIVLPEGVLNNSNLQEVRKFVEQHAKILLIVSIPQDVFIASGATVKPSLLFFKKFTEEERREFDEITAKSASEIDEKYKPQTDELQAIIDKSSKGLTKEEKTNLTKEKNKARARLKEIEKEKEAETWKLVKERIDYETPVAEVSKAGIDTTGKPCENELLPLAKEFTMYRAVCNLWEKVQKKTSYVISEDGNVSRFRIINGVKSAPEAMS